MSTPLDHIRTRLAEERTRKTLDLPVPGLADLGVHIRYARLVGIDQVHGYRTKRKGNVIAGNLDFLVDSCIGVWAEVDGERYGFSPDADTDPEAWPTFGNAVRDMLPEGVGTSAIDIARALFAAGYAPDERAAAEADIIEHGTQVMKFCGYAGSDAAGN